MLFGIYKVYLWHREEKAMTLIKVNKVNYKLWLKAAGVRALKTVAQTAAAMLSAATLISEVSWELVLSAAVLAGVYSLLTSLAGMPEVKEEE